jgi:hypothetical protein
MTFAAIFAFLKEVNWRKLLPQLALGALILGLAAALTITRIQLNGAKGDVEMAEMKRDLAIFNLNQCVENRESLEGALEETNLRVIKMGEFANQLGTQLAAATIRATDLAARNDELGNIEEKYHQLFQRAKELPVCTTYEWSLRLITGEEVPE